MRPYTRVSHVAREAGIGSREVLEFARSVGATDLRTPSSRIEEPIFAQLILEHFKGV